VDYAEPNDGSDWAEQLTQMERLLLRVGWLEQRCFARDLSQLGVTVPQFAVLRLIHQRGGRPTMTALADAMLLRCATLTGIVDRLVRTGLAVRGRDPEDRRRVLVELTARGTELVAQARNAREARVLKTLEHLTPEEAQELLRLLKLYLNALRRELETRTNMDH